MQMDRKEFVLIKNSPLFDIKCFIFKNAEVVVLEMIMSNEEAKEVLKNSMT